MPIDGKHRGKMEVGTKLVARYKGHDYECVVGQAKDGSVTYDIDGEHFKSPSRAGTHVMGGIACNGWRFWSVAGSEAATKAAKAPAKKAKRTAKPKAERKPRAKTGSNAAARNLAKEQARVDADVAKLKGVFERIGDGRYFCNGCMEPFAVDDDLEPKTCPKGHTPQADEAAADEAAAVAEEAAAVAD